MTKPAGRRLILMAASIGYEASTFNRGEGEPAAGAGSPPVATLHLALPLTCITIGARLQPCVPYVSFMLILESDSFSVVPLQA
jgi:hypothetical protein